MGSGEEVGLGVGAMVCGASSRGAGRNQPAMEAAERGSGGDGGCCVGGGIDGKGNEGAGVIPAGTVRVQNYRLAQTKTLVGKSQNFIMGFTRWFAS
jgi:hypothetical protein